MFCKHLKLAEYTLPNSPDCVLMRQIDAEKLFLRRNLIGTVVLKQVIDVEQRKHLLWCCEQQNHKTDYLPVFIDEMGARLPQLAEAKPATKQTFFYKNAYCYIVNQQKNGRMNVRLLNFFWHQSYVDALCRAQGFQPQEIYLVRLTDFGYKEEFGVCWQIIYADENGKDNGMILAVDLKESPKLTELNLNSIDYIPIKEGESVTINGLRYGVYKTNNNSYFLKKNLIQFTLCNK